MPWIDLPTWIAHMTEAGERTTHYVTEDQVLAPLPGRRARAVCGQVFLPASMAAPPGRLCHGCRAVVERPARRARPWWRGLRIGAR